jgi:RNA polymerase sigma-70 factor (ECF subfamily)
MTMGAERTTPHADFDAWVRPHLLAMTRLAIRLGGEAAADDLVQEALERAWRRRSTYDPAKGAAQPWLLAITADRARRHRTRHRPTSELVDSAAPHVDREGALDLQRAIARLPRKQRLAVELHYFVGLDVASTADALSCSPGTVKSQLSDARAHLRTTLGKDL